MAKTVMNYSDSVSFKLRQIFDLTGILEENLATWVNLSIFARMSPQIHTSVVNVQQSQQSQNNTTKNYLSKISLGIL
jgi:hypothetical protein